MAILQWLYNTGHCIAFIMARGHKVLHYIHPFKHTFTPNGLRYCIVVKSCPGAEWQKPACYALAPPGQWVAPPPADKLSEVSCERNQGPPHLLYIWNTSIFYYLTPLAHIPSKITFLLLFTLVSEDKSHSYLDMQLADLSDCRVLPCSEGKILQLWHLLAGFCNTILSYQ